MRIIAGNLKGSKLYIPRNKNTRPLRDLARESIFNLLVHSNKITLELENSNVLDLFAGTGSFGLECLSRRAKNVSFVEKGNDISKILKKNISKLKMQAKSSIFYDDVFLLIKKNIFLNSSFDLIFCDPPFNEINIENLMELIFNKKLLKKNGIIVLHRKINADDNLSNKFEILEIRKYGISKIIFGKLLF
jgi:16S rRNA (guanine966-N2)-methyltransferase